LIGAGLPIYLRTLVRLRRHRLGGLRAALLALPDQPRLAGYAFAIRLLARLPPERPRPLRLPPNGGYSNYTMAGDCHSEFQRTEEGVFEEDAKFQAQGFHGIYDA
jgi:hypothetical protein